MQQILTSYENEMFLHRDNLMIYESLFRSEIGISNRKLVFAYLDEQKKCSCLSITEGEIDSSKLLYDVICSKLKEEQIINIQYMNCVGLSCLILILLMKNNEYNIVYIYILLIYLKIEFLIEQFQLAKFQPKSKRHN